MVKKIKFLIKNFLNKSSVFRDFLYYSPSSIIKLRKVHAITFEVASGCNLRCSFCPVGNGKIKPKLMDLKTHNKIIDMLPSSIKEIRYSYRGEPFTNKDICKMLKYSHSKGFKTLISTNGMLIDKYIDELVECGLDRIFVAIDGATQETQEQYRVGSNIEKIKNNLKKLTEMRKKSKGKFPTEIVIQNVVSSKNEHEIKDMQNLTKEVVADKIKFKTIAISFGADYEKSKKEQEEYLPKNKNYWRTGNNNLICPFIWETIILYNGDISICCSDYLGKYLIGNILDENSFEKVVYSKKYDDIRKKIIMKKLPICKNCPITGDYWISDISKDFRKKNEKK